MNDRSDDPDDRHAAEDIERRHKEKMAKRKAVQDAEVASKTITRRAC